jgi:hypothetical protein
VNENEVGITSTEAAIADVKHKALCTLKAVSEKNQAQHY